MDRSVFHERLRSAVGLAVKFAGSMILDILQNNPSFIVATNDSNDSNIKGGETRFGALDLKPNEFWGPLENENLVVDLLWKNGLVPEWIDVCLATDSKNRQYIELHCCGRFTADEERLYYRERGIPPFSIKSPAIPSGVDQGGKFLMKKREILLMGNPPIGL
jgi:hypothetical protein